MTTSCPSRLAAGTRHELIAVHSVASVPSAAGRATSTEHAPHSPSAQPSLAPVSPQARRKSSALVCRGTPSSGRCSPLTTIPAIHTSPRASTRHGCRPRSLRRARPAGYPCEHQAVPATLATPPVRVTAPFPDSPSRNGCYQSAPHDHFVGDYPRSLWKSRTRGTSLDQRWRDEDWRRRPSTRLPLEPASPGQARTRRPTRRHRSDAGGGTREVLAPDKSRDVRALVGGLDAAGAADRRGWSGAAGVRRCHRVGGPEVAGWPVVRGEGGTVHCCR